MAASIDKSFHCIYIYIQLWCIFYSRPQSTDEYLGGASFSCAREGGVERGRRRRRRRSLTIYRRHSSKSNSMRIMCRILDMVFHPTAQSVVHQSQRLSQIEVLVHRTNSPTFILLQHTIFRHIHHTHTHALAQYLLRCIKFSRGDHTEEEEAQRIVCRIRASLIILKGASCGCLGSGSYFY